MKNIVELLNESKDIKSSEINDLITKNGYDKMSAAELKNEMKSVLKFVENDFKGKTGQLTTKVTTDNITFSYDRRQVFNVRFELQLGGNYSLMYGSIASYGSFEHDDDVFNIYYGVGEVLRYVKANYDYLVMKLTDLAALSRAYAKLLGDN